MSRQIVVLAVAVVVGALVGVLLLDRPAPAQGAGGAGGFHVVANDSAFVLYDSSGSNSWVLFPKPDAAKWAWFPLKRLDNDQQVQMWRVGAGKN